MCRPLSRMCQRAGVAEGIGILWSTGVLESIGMVMPPMSFCIVEWSIDMPHRAAASR